MAADILEQKRVSNSSNLHVLQNYKCTHVKHTFFLYLIASLLIFAILQEIKLSTSDEYVTEKNRNNYIRLAIQYRSELCVQYIS